jgi:protein phosphatase
MISIDIYGRTEKGQSKPINEDHILLGNVIKNQGRAGIWFDLPADGLSGPSLLVAVADGIGGEKGGANASRMTLTAFARHWMCTEEEGTIEEELRAAAQFANDQVCKAASGSDPELINMGSTLAGICISAEGVSVYSAGDSRVYLMRSGDVMQLTRNDIFLEQAVMMGVDPTAARSDPDASSLTNWVGKKQFKLNTTSVIPFNDGDVFVICSDGLFKSVSEERIGQVATRVSEPICDLGDILLSEALLAIDCDDTSIVIVRFAETENRGLRTEGEQ